MFTTFTACDVTSLKATLFCKINYQLILIQYWKLCNHLFFIPLKFHQNRIAKFHGGGKPEAFFMLWRCPWTLTSCTNITLTRDLIIGFTTGYSSVHIHMSLNPAKSFCQCTNADQNRGKAVSDVHTINNQTESHWICWIINQLISNPVLKTPAMKISFYEQHTVYSLWFNATTSVFLEG